MFVASDLFVGQSGFAGVAVVPQTEGDPGASVSWSVTRHKWHDRLTTNYATAGTTPDSSSVIPTLTSICQQLTYNFTMPMDQMPDDLIPLTFYYKQLLLNATYEQPLFIFLDSLNQLDGPNEVDVKLRCVWRPTNQSEL